MARTAVVAGTATAVSNRVARRQHGRWAEQEAKDQAYAHQQAGQQYAPPPPQYAQPPQQYAPAPADPPGQSTDDLIARLQQLGQLRDSGVLTDAEFEAQKAKIIAGA